MKKLWVGLVTGLLLVMSSISNVNASTLTGIMTVDDVFTIYVSTDDTVQGIEFGNGSDSWRRTYQNSINLIAGVDYFLHIYAYDLVGIAGFIGEFNLTGSGHMFANGETSLLTNATDWQGNNTGWGDLYVPLTDFGTNDVSLWAQSGSRGSISEDAHWIWAGSTTVTYLSTKITATSSPNPVPEPATLLLFGAGLAGLAAASRKKWHTR